METEYWKTMEVQPTFQAWKDYFEGGLACACDHGCNQWTKEQMPRMALFLRIMAKPCATTSLDRVAQIPIKKVAKIWFRLFWQDSRRQKKNG